ncbi:hypothetical protein HN011_006438 [Eciton burchellii]|nr:hypothetical protein HN011_006438 [Eciton burchellii]
MAMDSYGDFSYFSGKKLPGSNSLPNSRLILASTDLSSRPFSVHDNPTRTIAFGQATCRTYPTLMQTCPCTRERIERKVVHADGSSLRQTVFSRGQHVTNATARQTCLEERVRVKVIKENDVGRGRGRATGT